MTKQENETKNNPGAESASGFYFLTGFQLIKPSSSQIHQALNHNGYRLIF